MACPGPGSTSCWPATGSWVRRPSSRARGAPSPRPGRVPLAMRDEIVALRKALREEGLDARAHTIQYHLQGRHRRNKKAVPSTSSIWRVLKRRDFIVPERSQAAQVLLCAVLRRAAQRVLAGRHHPLGPSRRHRRRGAATSSTTTPATWSPRRLSRPPRPPTWWQLSKPQLANWDYRRHC